MAGKARGGVEEKERKDKILRGKGRQGAGEKGGELGRGGERRYRFNASGGKKKNLSGGNGQGDGVVRVPPGRGEERSQWVLWRANDGEGKKSWEELFQVDRGKKDLRETKPVYRGGGGGPRKKKRRKNCTRPTESRV